MSQAFGQFDKEVLSRLRGLGRRLRAYALLDGLAVFSVSVVIAAVATFLVDFTFRLELSLRVAQLASILAALVAIIWRAFIRPLLAPIELPELAVLIEKRYPQLSSRLISAVEFVLDTASNVEASSAMIHSTVESARVQAENLAFHSVLAHDRARRRGLVVLVCAATLALAGVARPATMSIWLKRNVLLSNVDWPLRNRLKIENLADGRIIVPREEDLTVSAVVERGYEAPRQAFIEYDDNAGQVGRQQMPAMSQDVVRFTHTFERLSQSLRCRVIGGDAETEWFAVDVVDRPQVVDPTLEIVPPSYTHMEPYRLRAGLTAAETLNGSEVRFAFTASKPLKRATLVRVDADREVVLGEARSADQVRFASSIRPQATSIYQFDLQDQIGLTNRSERLVPVRFTIRLIADKPPSAKLRLKDAGDMITVDAILPVELSFTDQYGLATAGLVYEVARQGATNSPVFEGASHFEPGSKSFNRLADFSAAAHKLAEGDRLGLYAQASDFDDVAGPNIGKSAPVFLRIVSQEELLSELSRREQEHRRDFERLVRQQEELYNELLAGPRRDASQEDHREFYPRLARRQRDYAGRLNLLRLQFEQVLNRLRINQLATPAVEARLGRGVIASMDQLYRRAMPQAAQALEALPPDATGAALRASRAAQEAVLADMNRILASLLKWEGYQEAVTLLREVLKMQKSLGQETETRVEKEVLGNTTTAPATQTP